MNLEQIKKIEKGMRATVVKEFATGSREIVKSGIVVGTTTRGVNVFSTKKDDADTIDFAEWFPFETGWIKPDGERISFKIVTLIDYNKKANVRSLVCARS